MGLFRKKNISQSYKKAKGFFKKSRHWEGHENDFFYDPIYDFRQKNTAKKKSWWKHKK